MLTSFQRDRRNLLVGAGALTFSAVAPSISLARTLGDNPFTLGVAAGDPWPDGFVIWTRLALRPLEENGGMEMVAYPVRYEVAADPQFREIVRQGEALARPELGHSIHVELAHLQAGRPYWYRFFAAGEESATGVARTAPTIGAKPDQVRIGVAGCQHYESGFYTAYRHLAEESSIDAVFHYGDYIYEGKAGTNTLRQHVGDEIYSLSDYRRRYAQYKTDADLQAAHASAAFIVSFDDHEVDNNWAAMIDQDGTPPEFFAYRRAAALQAWYENLPVRRAQLPQSSSVTMHRRLDFGSRLRMHVMDTRQYRTDQICGDGVETRPCATAPLESGSILGAAQEQWLGEGMSKEFSWNLLAQQVMVMPLLYPEQRRAGRHNMDSWSGYPASRKRLVKQIEERYLTNVIIATGDVHSHHAGQLPSIEDDYTSKPVATEFVTTSISSNGDGFEGPNRWGDMEQDNPHCHLNLDKRGYQVLSFGEQEMTCDVMVVDSVVRAGGSLSLAARFHVDSTHNRLNRF